MEGHRCSRGVARQRLLTQLHALSFTLTLAHALALRLTVGLTQVEVLLPIPPDVAAADLIVRSTPTTLHVSATMHRLDTLTLALALALALAFALALALALARTHSATRTHNLTRIPHRSR